MTIGYLNDPDKVAALVRKNQVHRDLYISEEVFELEQAHLFPNSWIFVGHDSQVPKAGDYTTTAIAGVPVVMVRDGEGEVRVLENRCAHKGARVAGAVAGNCGKFFRCSYHGWTYRHDGSILAIPGEKYDNTGFDQCESARGMLPVGQMRNYRGFIFVCLNATGPDFDDYFGDSLSSIDNMVDRAPDGRLEVAGGILRYMHDCNWKMFIENLNDTMHPMVAHESSAGTARKLWAKQPADSVKPMVIEQFVPFVSGYDVFDAMGVRIYPNGHSYSGAKFSIHSDYSAVSDYDHRMIAAYGETRAREILGEVRHNTVYYPTLTIKGAIQAIRIARPIAANRTMIESWTFRLAGAPPELLQRTLMYSRLINAPTSVVGHDDLHCYRSIQEGLQAPGNEWVSLHRRFEESERDGMAGVYDANTELSMRSQFAAWRDTVMHSMHSRQANHG